MKKILYPILIILMVQSGFAQENHELSKYKEKIKSYLKAISDEGDINVVRIIGERKIIVKGSFQNGKMRFRQVIKFYKNGLKKENTKVYDNTLKGNSLIADVIMINSRLFYAKLAKRRCM